MLALTLGTLLGLSVWFLAVMAGVVFSVVNTGIVYDISVLVTAAGVMAPFLGGFTAGWIIKKRGWVHGGWVGVFYTLVAALLAALVFQGLLIFDLFNLIINFCLGCVGGVCGVNTRLYAARSRYARTRDSHVLSKLDNR